MKPPLSMPDERAYWRSAICWGITVPLSGAVGDSCMSAFDALLTLKLSIQRALLGEVTDRLIAVTCGLEERHIQIRAYVSGKVAEEDIERIQFVGAEVIADFPDGYTIDESSASVDDGEPHMLDFCAFSRAKQ